jgi:hypothetical protein
MKSLLTFIFSLVLLMFTSDLFSQLNAYSGGLTFSSGIDYNTGTTGNPGLFAKMYFEVDKKLHIVPALSVYKAYKKSDLSQGVELRNFMFQADVDAVFSLYKDKSLRFMGFAGLNTTTIISKWNKAVADLENKSDLKPGLNLGGAFQLYVDDNFDAYISAKYVVSSFSQLVINVGAIYYVGGKRRRGAW